MDYPQQRLELGKKHKRGRRTFFFIFIHKCWWLTLAGIGFWYVAWAVYWGNLKQQATVFLAAHPTWYISTGMLAQWFAFIGISFFLIAYLRANVFYRIYKFFLDEYAVHLRQGLFYISETTIPYHQISNVHIARPYHYRILGLARLDIVTAADRSDDRLERSAKKFLVPIIDLSLARTLSRQLLENAAYSRRYGNIAVDTDEENISEETSDTDDNGSELE